MSVVNLDDPGGTSQFSSPSPPAPPYSLCNPFSPKLRQHRRGLISGTYSIVAGDFLSVVSLLRDLTDALQRSDVTPEEHKQLIAELRTLESAILQAEAQYGVVDSPAKRIVLDQAVQACQETVNDFLSSVMKHYHNLSSPGPDYLLKDALPTLQWNLITAKQLGAFQVRISAHVQTIQTLLITIQVSNTNLAHLHGSSGNKVNHLDNMSHSLVLINNCFDTLRQALVAQGSISQQTLANVDAVGQLMVMNNVQLLSALKQLQDFLPPQVLLQKPVIFTDALDRVAPIHLDWICSWDAFLAVLEHRFTHLGYNKIKRREFALQETATRKEVPFTRSIDICLAPGQHVDMSMVFQDQSGEESRNTCPHCHAHCEGSMDSETTCAACGCQFRRIQQQDEQSEVIRDTMAIDTIVADSAAKTTKKRKRSRDSAAEEEVQPSDFKRLRLMYSVSPRLQSSAGSSHASAYTQQLRERQQRTLQKTAFGSGERMADAGNWHRIPFNDQWQETMVRLHDHEASPSAQEHQHHAFSASSERDRSLDKSSPGRGLSIPRGFNPFLQTYSDQSSKLDMDLMAAPYASQSSVLSDHASPAVSNFLSTPRQYSVPPAEDWRRRTWHPSTYPASGYKYARSAMSGLSYAQDADTLQPTDFQDSHIAYTYAAPASPRQESAKDHQISFSVSHRGEDSMLPQEYQMMPPQIHPQSPYPHLQQNGLRASPPVPNGMFPLPRDGTPQPQMGSRPSSRNTVRKSSSNPLSMQYPHSTPSTFQNGFAYMPNPPIYNPQAQPRPHRSPQLQYQQFSMQAPSPQQQQQLPQYPQMRNPISLSLSRRGTGLTGIYFLI